MKRQKLAHWILTFELMALVFVLANIYHMSPAEASFFRLYEILGAVTAVMITTFGLYEMQRLT